MSKTARLITLIACAGLVFLACVKLVPDKKMHTLSSIPIVEEVLGGVHARRFEKGEVIQDLKMQSWLHYKGETVTHMVAPFLRAYHHDGRIWEISAKEGKGFQTQIGKKIDKLHLSNDVMVQELAQNSHFWWEMKTDNLLFFPTTLLAFTAEPVTVNSEGLVITSQGIRAKLDKHEIEFLKNVECHYAKPHA